MVTELKLNGRLALRSTGTLGSPLCRGRCRRHLLGQCVESRNHPAAQRLWTSLRPAKWDNLQIRVDAPLPDRDALIAPGFNVAT